MSDRVALIVGLLTLVVLGLFIGSWFGWARVCWIIVSAIAVFIVAGFLKGLAEGDESMRRK